MNGRLYKNILDSKAREFKRNRYIKNGVELSPEILEKLEDNEIELINKFKGTIKVSA